MSSHHIVREKQEPALIIANGEACQSEIIEELLEWSPFVMVLDGAYERVHSLGIKIDLLFGDFDGIRTELDQIKETQFPIEIIHAPDQDKTDLEKAIEYLIDKGFPAVNIIWATGLRADHTFANISNLPKYAEKIKLKIIDNHSLIYPILPSPHIYKKWFKAKTSLSLIPINRASEISTKNLRYPLNNESLILGQRTGNSNEVLSDGIVEIVYNSGALLIMECKD